MLDPSPSHLSSLLITCNYFHSVQIIFFTVIASKVKENANGARTFLEIVKARFGMSAHIMFTVCQNLILNVSNIITNFFLKFYALFTSLMVVAILLLGGSASMSALTGMDVRAATMLLPIGVIAYVIVGGLRSTFISDYVHTTIVFIIIWLFIYTVSIDSVVSEVKTSLTYPYDRLAQHPILSAHRQLFMHFSSKPQTSLQSRVISMGPT